MREYTRKTDEELIEAVNNYIEKYPNASRNQVIMHSTGCAERVRGLAKKGLVKLPAPLPTGSKSNWNRYFNLVSENNASRKGMKYSCK